MATAISDHVITKEVLQALGVDGKGVRKIVFIFEHGNIAQVQITCNLDKGAGGKLIDELKKYKLVEIDNNLEG